MNGGARWSVRCAVIGLALVGSGFAAPARGQELADFDYENLSFRGVGLDWGYLWPSRVEPTQSFAARMDLGYLGPGLRIVPSIGYWSSRFEADEVRELEDRVASLITRQTDVPSPTVNLGVIDWSDIMLGFDAHVVWAVPFNVLTFAGLGASAHLMNGDGEAVNGTFVEDLLDSVTAGFNLHAGAEYLISDRLRLYGQGRYEVLGDLQFFQIRSGLQVMFSAPAPGEERTR